jgi:hypothetical protein
MKEIGGYFELERAYGKEYHEGLVALNTGRNALLYILKSRQIKKLYIPYYLCDSVSRMCDREGYVYEYYPIGRDWLPDFRKPLDDGEYLYIVNYYGQLSNAVLGELKTRYRNVIIDNVHAFFQEPLTDTDTIYSCRKFFGVPDGAYLATDSLLQEKLDTDVSMDRMKHLLGRLEGENASQYHADFKNNDVSFRALPLRYMSLLTHNILRSIDYDRIIRIREKNYRMLHAQLSEYNEISVSYPIGPYAYPFYCKRGMELRKSLAEKKIYVATLWPNVLGCDDATACDLAENILPLPCDQRYCRHDMLRMIRKILRFI